MSDNRPAYAGYAEECAKFIVHNNTTLREYAQQLSTAMNNVVNKTLTVDQYLEQTNNLVLEGLKLEVNSINYIRQKFAEFYRAESQ
jgi:glutamine amidotransferase-like uncharacterized protein